MPINVDLLIAAPMLQDYLVDKDGTPMTAGIVTCYQDNSRTTLKNWYYQSGTPGNYTYIRLPNPLTLSAAGTICDINGVDTIPFFYPYSELDETDPQPYYITIVNHAATNQITRSNFPFLPPSINQPTTATSFNNLIVNNGFWRNILPNNLNNTPFNSTNISSKTSLVVAPSQHDSFQYPDVNFIKNNTSATEALTFIPFPLSNKQPILNQIVPEYYLNHDCTGAGTGETQKCYQFPISLHVNTLANVPYTLTIQAENIGGTGTGQNVISLFILQDTGTGSSPPALFRIGQITLTSGWASYSFKNIFPSTAGLTLGNGADDALYLQVQMPLNTTCNINFTKPSIYLTQNVIPANDFQTYDQVDTIINSPRTGDIRTSLNRFYPYGWVAMNDGTIGNINSNATAYEGQDAFPLFNLLWSLFSNYNNTTTNLLAQMYNSSGSAIAYGASAIADWTANNTIALTKMMGKVMLGSSPLLLNTYSTTFTSTSNVITAANTVGFFNGMPVNFTGTSVLSTKLIYYVASFNGTTQFRLASTFANAMAGTTLTFANDSGTVSSTLQGSVEGEYAHTQLTAEVGSHTHTGTVAIQSALGATGSSVSWMLPGSTTPLSINANSPAGTPFNVTQPGTFYNMFIKL